ncbi:YeeE/YedE family protein [Epibacterium ulvae]|uniref:YeeE/YedE family protein n=1 Tax=Epibacterium ulvae TaxID=1156985 RepID=UPI001BFCBC08|nr:YeeE/YedE thiosulfate transporter family protein [Epibacterium ulvae]MBT8152834.1 YeeE/YedE family protein [Epibacterium ulvae]
MQQDWIWGLLGGGLIGLGGALLLLGNGRIMGASGILGGLIARHSDRALQLERLIFVAAVIGVPFFLHHIVQIPVETTVTQNLPLLLTAGVLVGIGTRVANGCTSGHGVCGISRLSVRGITATVLYIGAGALTVSVMRHLFGALS